MKIWIWGVLAVALASQLATLADEKPGTERFKINEQMAANETKVLVACKAYASAQDTFRRVDYNGNGILEYAQCLGGGEPRVPVKVDPTKVPTLEKGDEELVKSHLDKMASEDFGTRETATAALKAMGSRIIPLLETSAAALNDAEAKSRATGVLSQLKKAIQPKPARNTEWGLYQGGKINLVDKAFADAEGAPSENPIPKNGYCFVVLTSQTKNAPGGARSYLNANGCMTIGYALLAYPAEYDKTGRNCFQISGSGTIYQKDLGENTKAIVEKFDAFDPNTSWVAAE